MENAEALFPATTQFDEYETVDENGFAIVETFSFSNYKRSC